MAAAPTSLGCSTWAKRALFFPLDAGSTVMMLSLKLDVMFRAGSNQQNKSDLHYFIHGYQKTQPQSMLTV